MNSELLTSLCKQVCNLSESYTDWSWPNWPLTLFIKDLQDYPLERDKLIESLAVSTDDYLLFFFESRGYERPYGYYVSLWKEVQGSNVLLYLERDVSRLLLLDLDSKLPEDDDFIVFIEILMKHEYSDWSSIIKQINGQG